MKEEYELGKLTVKRRGPIAALARSEEAASSHLDALSGNFGGLLERMQTPAARKEMEAAFNAEPEALGRAAVRAVRRRR